MFELHGRIFRLLDDIALLGDGYGRIITRLPNEHNMLVSRFNDLGNGLYELDDPIQISNNKILHRVHFYRSFEAGIEGVYLLNPDYLSHVPANFS